MFERYSSACLQKIFKMRPEELVQSLALQDDSRCFYFIPDRLTVVSGKDECTPSRSWFIQLVNSVTDSTQLDGFFRPPSMKNYHKIHVSIVNWLRCNAIVVEFVDMTWISHDTLIKLRSDFPKVVCLSGSELRISSRMFHWCLTLSGMWGVHQPIE